MKPFDEVNNSSIMQEMQLLSESFFVCFKHLPTIKKKEDWLHVTKNT